MGVQLFFASASITSLGCSASCPDQDRAQVSAGVRLLDVRHQAPACPWRSPQPPASPPPPQIHQPVGVLITSRCADDDDRIALIDEPLQHCQQLEHLAPAGHTLSCSRTCPNPRPASGPLPTVDWPSARSASSHDSPIFCALPRGLSNSRARFRPPQIRSLKSGTSFSGYPIIWKIIPAGRGLRGTSRCGAGSD